MTARADDNLQSCWLSMTVHIVEIKRYGWGKWNGKSNKQHI